MSIFDDENASFINILLSRYSALFPDMERITVNITVTDNLNKTHAEIRPDLADYLIEKNPQSDYNGRLVLPINTNETSSILLNRRKIEEYTLDGSMTWIGTLAHEYTHAVDYHQMAELKGIKRYDDMEAAPFFMMFYQWTEYHARKKGYMFLRSVLEETGNLPGYRDQVNNILEFELPQQTMRFLNDYNLGATNERLYLTMQYLGRFSVWMDLFADTFGYDEFKKHCMNAVWMVDLLMFLREHETLYSINDHFEEMKSILSQNWSFA